MHFSRNLAVAAVILGVTTVDSWADDGYFSFLGSPFTSSVWENFSTGDFQRSAHSVNVTFFWGPQNSVPAVDAIMTFTPTNSIPVGIPPWDILFSDGLFTQAIDSSTGLPAIANTTMVGGYSYNAASPFPVAGTTGQSIYTVYVIGWDAVYPTPQAAAAAGSPLGWSNPVQYTAGTFLVPPPTLSGAGILPFGVNTIPEPSIGGLAAWAVAMLFATRRR